MSPAQSEQTTPSMPVAGLQPLAGNRRPADLVVRNGRVYTGNAAAPSASAIAIRDGMFVEIGDDRDVAAFTGPTTQVVDAIGRRIIPGLNDSHQHVIRTGLHFLLELRWDGVSSLALALHMLKAQAERTPPGQWVRVVGGWSREQFREQRIPTVAELNRAAPDTPVIVTHLYQAALLNRAALETLGFNKATPDPPGGEFVRDHGGNPTGLLLAAPSALIIYTTLAKLPGLSPEEQVTSTRHLLRELNRFGLTSAIDAAGGFQSFPENYASVLELADAGDLSVRLAYYLFPQTPGQELNDIRRWTETVRPGDGDRWLRCNGVGESLAWSLNDFENFAQPRPELEPRAASELEAGARLLLDNGWGFRLHATYDETIRADLDVFERIATDGGWPDGTPWLCDHAETVSRESLERIKALGGAIGVQHRMHYQGGAFLQRYGRVMASSAPPIRAMLDLGIRVAAGTDAPRVSSYNPWVSLSWLVTGRTIGGIELYPPENRVSRETALDMYTNAGADISGEGDVKGTIEIGKYGDLAVLSADFFEVPEDEISGIESVLTVVDGRIVYSAGDYANVAQPIEPNPIGWSPLAHFGAYQQSGSGTRQARSLAEAASESEDEHQWRRARGDTSAFASPNGGCW